jgi:hypothetical protein
MTPPKAKASRHVQSAYASGDSNCSASSASAAKAEPTKVALFTALTHSPRRCAGACSIT